MMIVVILAIFTIPALIVTFVCKKLAWLGEPVSATTRVTPARTSAPPPART